MHGLNEGSLKNTTVAHTDAALPSWSLAHFPNYANARQLDTVDADQITKKEFFAQQVNRNRPCLIKNAIRHWPAYQKWCGPDYLQAHSANRPVTVRTGIVSETIGWSGAAIKAQLIAAAAKVYQQIPFHDFLAQTAQAGEPLVADSCRFTADSALAALKDDVGGLPFMPILGQSRVYPPHRVFLYRNSYTDWHFHSADETFMAQVIGAKEVLILPPDNECWEQLILVIEKTGRLFQIDTNAFPGMRALRPYRVLVEPGDALYIPVFWWHAVQSVNHAFGATVAATFSTPLHINGNLTFPMARRLAKTHLFSRHAPLVLGAIAYAAGYKIIQHLRP